ncbi:preprotein translocase subunit YajC [Gammaproteobacteria bacterium]|nr:preprotein translocase subunit YajC [Gammaproteobacteria bacterium]
MEPAQGSLLSPLIFVGFLFVFMYFIIIRPQNKRNKEIADMVAQVEKGTEVIGAGGILGKVTEVKDLYVSIEIASGTVIKLQKSAIANILPKGTIDSI